MRNVPPNLYAIRTAMGCFHLLVEDNGASAVLLDAGFFGDAWLVRRLLRKLRLAPQAIRAILLTHGHLDHVGGLPELQAWTDASVWAHEEERAHVAGTYPYTGLSRVCGWLEALGRRVLRLRIGHIDHTFSDGEMLPFWGGLEVVHLPGHTRGHCGFYSAKHDVLFTGDLFASYFFNTHLPPPILNSVPAEFPGSLARVAALNPRWIVPNHYDFLDGALHRKRFDGMYRRMLERAAKKADIGTIRS